MRYTFTRINVISGNILVLPRWTKSLFCFWQRCLSRALSHGIRKVLAFCSNRDIWDLKLDSCVILEHRVWYLLHIHTTSGHSQVGKVISVEAISCVCSTVSCIFSWQYCFSLHNIHNDRLQSSESKWDELCSQSLCEYESKTRCELETKRMSALCWLRFS